MNINTDFYTTAQEDVSGRYGMKRFSKTLKAMISDNELPVNSEWDMSISPFAINPRKHPDAYYNCDLINKCWLFPDINNITGIADDTPPREDMILKPHMYARQTYYPFMMYSGDGGQGNGWAFPYYPGRVGNEQTSSGDFTNYKWNLYGITKYAYNRLVWLIRVFVSTYGHNNAELTVSNINYGSWYDLADITDELWTQILSGTRCISGVRFIPYYANNENNLNSRATSLITGFNAMAKGEPLDGGASGLGILAPYTEEFIDYALASYAAIGTTDSEGARGGNPTIALGNIADYGNNSFKTKYLDNDYNSHWYDSLSAWAADGNFIESQAYQINGTDSTVWKTEVYQSSEYIRIYYRQHLNTDILISKDLCRKYLLSQAAYLGGYFTDKSLTAYGGELNSADMYLGIIESDGMTAGRYQRGAEIVPPDIDDPWTDIGFVPPPPDPDPNEYDDNETVLNNVAIIPKFTTRYILTTGEISHAHSFLMSEISSNVDSDFWSSQTLYVNNPIDVVQSVILFPFNIANYQTDEPSYKDLAFGQLIDDGYSVQLNREQYCVLNLGSCTYFPKFGNNEKDFRNYPPYSSATLYIPYCGSVEIDPNLYMNHRISVKMIVDMATGSCLALIYRDNMVVDSISGTIGITFPITGIQSQTLAAAERQAEQQLKTARVNGAFNVANAVTGVSGGAAGGAAAGFMSGGLAGAIAGGIIGGASKAVSGAQTVYNDVQNIKNAQYNLEHVQVPYKTIGTATASTSWANERKCRLIIRRPLMMNYDPETYGHTVGYACLQTATVGEFSGFTVFQTVNLDGISATEQEKTELFNILQGGVYL